MSNETIPGYCRDLEVDDLRDCHKIVDGRCTVYLDVCAKVGKHGIIGCAFSPLERPVQTKGRNRVGQQKQRRF